jgi:hypothetical protein
MFIRGGLGSGSAAWALGSRKHTLHRNTLGQPSPMDGGGGLEGHNRRLLSFPGKRLGRQPKRRWEDVSGRITRVAVCVWDDTWQPVKCIWSVFWVSQHHVCFDALGLAMSWMRDLRQHGQLDRPKSALVGTRPIPWTGNRREKPIRFVPPRLPPSAFRPYPFPIRRWRNADLRVTGLAAGSERSGRAQHGA